MSKAEALSELSRLTPHERAEILAAGDSVDDLLAKYPSLTREDVLACIEMSAELMSHHFSLRRCRSPHAGVWA